MFPFQHLQKSNTRDNIWIYILLFLKERKEIYAWELQELIEKRFNFKPGRITSYRVLYRLEKDGFVTSIIKDRKRFYQITEKGRKELQNAKKFFQKLSDKLK